MRSFINRYHQQITAILSAIAVALIALIYFPLGCFGVVDVGAILGFVSDEDYNAFIDKFLQTKAGMSSEEWITTYFEDYYEYISTDYWGLAEGSGGIYGSDNNFNDVYLDATEQQLAMFFAGNGIPFNWDDFCAYAKARRSAELQSSAFSSSDYVSSKDIQPPKISSEGFKYLVEKVEGFYCPSGTLSRVSWKAAEYWNTFKQQRPDYAVERRFTSTNIFKEGRFCSSSDSLYLCPYYYDGQSYYYGKEILCLYVNGSSGVGDLYYQVYNGVDGSASDPVKLVDSFKSLYMDVGLAYSDRTRLNFCHYKDYASYEYNASYRSGATMYYGEDGAFQISFGDTSTFMNVFKSSDSSLFDGNQLYDLFNNKDWTTYSKDYGFVFSADYFAPSIGGYTDLDPEKIPANTTVTITGDELPDYTYTDNSTGDTTTIYNYITNNYTYPEGSGGSDSGGSGSSGDVDITVGGHIDIKSDPIDINVNVGNNYPEITPPTMEGVSEAQQGLDDLITYYDDSSKSVGGLFTSFYGILPPPIANMIPLAVAVIIFIGLVKALH